MDHVSVCAGAHLAFAPCSGVAVRTLQHELGVSHVLAQVLVRRGLGDPDEARMWLDAAERHPAVEMQGVPDAVSVMLKHCRSASRITIHGDYDVDGVCSAAILIRCLRLLGADVDWYLPGRLEDGYGLSSATVRRLAARGTRLLVTADCAITAVAEVTQARAAGLEVVVTDHHAPRADGSLPDAPIVHPGLGGYPCPELCATGVAHKLARALLGAAGVDPGRADEDLDLVALATVADVVALRGENRRLVREGLRALAVTTKPGLRALMRVARVDPSGVDEQTVAFRLAPRINAAGRLYRADAALELVLSDDEDRSAAIATELDRANAERRHTETRILFEAEAQVAQVGQRPAYVLAGEGWHPGVIGIVASRLAERHHRPTILIALPSPVGPADRGDGALPRGTGSGRSIPGFDLLAALEAGAEHLSRFGGHRAAAGLEIDPARVEAFRGAFTAHADAVLAPEDLLPRERVDAVASGDDLGLELAEELRRLAPFGAGNPSVSLLIPAAELDDARPMGEGRHVRFTVQAGGVRSSAVAFGNGGRLPVALHEPVDASFTLELNRWGGAVEPRLVLRQAQPCHPAAIECVGEPSSFLVGVWEELELPLADDGLGGHVGASTRCLCDRRGRGVAGTIGALVAGEEPVLVVCANTERRLSQLRPRLGGFSLCSYRALERDRHLAEGFPHVVALDPPAHAHLLTLLGVGDSHQATHLAWGEAELRFALQVHEHENDLRCALAALYRQLRSCGDAQGHALQVILRGDEAQPRSAALAGRLLRILGELGLVEVDRRRQAVEVPAAHGTDLNRSPAFLTYQRLYEDGRRYLSGVTALAA